MRLSLMAAMCLLMAPMAPADTHTDRKTQIAIDFPDKWNVEQADAVVASSPDHLATMLVIAMKNTGDAADALQKLDRDDVMGGQIKNIKQDEKMAERKIHGLPATIFTGSANVANVKVRFLAVVIADGGPAYVVFAVPANQEHVKAIQKSIDSIRGPKSEK